MLTAPTSWHITLTLSLAASLAAGSPTTTHGQTRDKPISEARNLLIPVGQAIRDEIGDLRPGDRPIFLTQAKLGSTFGEHWATFELDALGSALGADWMAENGVEVCRNYGGTRECRPMGWTPTAVGVTVSAPFQDGTTRHIRARLVLPGPGADTNAWVEREVVDLLLTLDRSENGRWSVIDVTRMPVRVSASSTA